MNSLPRSLMRMAAGLAMVTAPILVAAVIFMPQLGGAGAATGLKALDLWAVTVVAVALCVYGYSVRRGATAFGLLAAVLILGGGAQLYLTDPLWFPALRLRPGGTLGWPMAAMLAVEAAVAAVSLLKFGPGRLIALAREKLGLGKTAVFVGLSVVFSVPILGYLGQGAAASYLAHLVAGGGLILIHLAILFAMTRVRPPMTGMTRIMPIVPAVVAVIASAVLSWTAFERLPHVQDELAYLFQARTFASGALTLPAPPEVAMPGLEYYLLEIKDGRWYSTTQPGWPALLALGILAGVPWLLNPILAGLSVLLAYDITRRRAGTDAGDLVALLMATSPWVLTAAASLMPHMMTLALILLAWWLVLRSEDTGRRPGLAALLAGLAMGLIFAARPMDGLVIGILTGLWIVTGRDRPWLRALQYSVGVLAVLTLFLAYNAHITGNPLLMPLTDYLARSWGPGANAYGFGPDIGPPGGWRALDLWPGHGPVEAVLNTINCIVSLAFEMLGWPVGSLALLLTYLLWQKKQGFDLAMILVAGVVVVVMALYWYADTYYLGPRYWFIAAFPFVYLSARGAEALRARVTRRRGNEHLTIDAAIIICCLFGLCVFTPWRGVAKFSDYGGFYSLFRDEEAKGTFGNDIVLFTEVGDRGSALALNDLTLQGNGPIYLRDTGNIDIEALAAAFPDRAIRRYTPDWKRRK